MQAMESLVGNLRGVVARLDGMGRGGGGQRQTFSDADVLVALHSAALGRPHAPIINAVTTFGGDSTSGSSGGFAVGEQHEGVLMAAVSPGSLIDRMSPIFVKSPVVVAAVDEGPDWATTPINVSKYAEGEAILSSKPAFRRIEAVAYKLGALMPLTDELVEDAGQAMRPYVASRLGYRIKYQGEDWILNGTGLGQPLGVLNAAALVTVAADAGQTAGTITAKNIGRMIGRLAPGGFERSFWVVHSSAFAEIANLSPLFSGPAPGAPWGYLAGRPIVVSEAAKALGSVGDIILIDPQGFLCAVSGPTLKETIAFSFDQGLRSFKATMRLACAPLLAAAVARASGGDALSACVTLAARS